jgi:hypothetical protein
MLRSHSSLSKKLVLVWLSLALGACGGGGDDTPGSTTARLGLTLSGTGRVTSSPAGIDCGTTCAADYAIGTSVVLTATPSPGQSLASWGGACASAGAVVSTCTVVMSQARSAAVTFAPTSGAGTFALVVAVAGTGVVTSAPAGINCGATCSADFAENVAVTLTAVPASGQMLSAWSGACSGTNSVCTVTMSAARNVTATFAPVAPVNFALAVTLTGSGTVSSQPAGITCGMTCSANFASGTAVTLTATPAAGQILSGWGGACAGNSSTCAVQMTVARTVTVAFTTAPAPAGWSGAAAISTPGASAPVVAIDNTGNAIAVWLQANSGSTVDDLVARRYVPGSGWSAQVLLETDDVADIQQGEQHIAMEPVSGRAIVTWHQFTSATRFDLWARTFDPVTGWGVPARIEESTDTVGESRAGIDAAGNAIVVWAQAGTSGRFSLYTNRYSATSGWGTRQLLETNDFVGGLDGDPRIAVSPAGDALVVWKMDPGISGSGIHFWSSRYTVASGWSTAAQLVQDTGSNQSFGRHEIAMDSVGNAMLAWGQIDSLQLTIQTKRNISGTWQSGSSPIAPGVQIVNTIATPAIAMNATGVAVVSWAQDDYSIRAAVAPAGGAFSMPAVIKVAGPREVLSLPSLGIDTAGNVFAAWQQKGVANANDIWISRYVAGAGWGASSIHVPSISQTVPVVAMAGNGNAVLTWHTFETNGTVAYARYYTAGP